MGLIRLLLIGVAIYAVYTYVRRLGTPSQQNKVSHDDTFSDTVRCAHCGVHLPRDRAIRSKDGHYYCSPEHRDSNQA